MDMRTIDIDLPNEFAGLEDRVFVVGGFVRDTLLGRSSNDVDLMVAGVSVEEMESRDFQRVDATSFPVFLDSLGREVALPRTEESTGAGHNDFEMAVISEDVPVEEAVRQDLERRDLTINAMAVNLGDGELFDPFDGQRDLSDGVVRHVSEAFREDPLRVVRAARFAARFDFEIAEETRDMMEDVAPRLADLPDDRFGHELISAFEQANEPRQFFDELDDVGALEFAFPELAALQDVPAGPPEHHSEGDALEHTLRVLDEMHSLRGNDVEGLLAVLGHDLGKVETPDDVLPSHHGHGDRGVDVASEMRSRLGLSRDLRGVMSLASREHMRLHAMDEMGESSVVDLAESVADSDLSVGLMADLQSADAAGREPAGEDLSDLVRCRLGAAVEVVEQIGGAEALESRDMSPADVGSEIPGENVSNLVRQDRVEELRARL